MSVTSKGNSRKKYNPEIKLKIVLESLQRDTTIESVRRQFDVHTTQINAWRKAFLSKTSALGEFVFGEHGRSKKGSSLSNDNGRSTEELTKLIGELTIENQILKKALGSLA
jgi:transposase-like protein